MISNIPMYYSSPNFTLYLEDCLNLLTTLESNSVDMIFADPPYFLSNNGITCASGKMVCVNKGDWDVSKTIQEIHSFNTSWLKECQRILSPNGTIWISGTYHNIYSIGMALQELEFKILNNITWKKNNPPPNLACRCFTHSTETILWASKNKKAKHYYNYKLMKELNGNKQMQDVWNFPTTPPKEKVFGKHPTQKPLTLLRRIILSSSTEGALILDPFNGSGTTGIAAIELNRRYIGIDTCKDYLDLTIRRYEGLSTQLSFNF